VTGRMRVSQIWGGPCGSSWIPQRGHARRRRPSVSIRMGVTAAWPLVHLAVRLGRSLMNGTCSSCNPRQWPYLGAIPLSGLCASPSAAPDAGGALGTCVCLGRAKCRARCRAFFPSAAPSAQVPRDDPRSGHPGR